MTARDSAAVRALVEVLRNDGKSWAEVEDGVADARVRMAGLVWLYESAARFNRPDWATFLAEAAEDVEAVAYEVEENSDGPVAGYEFGVLVEVVADWVRAKVAELETGGPAAEPTTPIEFEQARVWVVEAGTVDDEGDSLIDSVWSSLEWAEERVAAIDAGARGAERWSVGRLSSYFLDVAS